MPNHDGPMRDLPAAPRNPSPTPLRASLMPAAVGAYMFMLTWLITAAIVHLSVGQQLAVNFAGAAVAYLVALTYHRHDERRERARSLSLELDGQIAALEDDGDGTRLAPQLAETESIFDASEFQDYGPAEDSDARAEARSEGSLSR